MKRTDPPAIALIEFASIARAIRTGDAMVKRSEVRVLRAEPVSPGKYLILITGGEAEVEESWREGLEIGADQVLYNLSRRGVENRLLPWCASRGVAVMAYSPLEQGRLLQEPALQVVAGRHGVSTGQAALAWVLRNENMVAIPKAVDPQHVRENAASLDVHLTGEDLAELDAAFPVPAPDTPLETL